MLTTVLKSQLMFFERVFGAASRFYLFFYGLSILHGKDLSFFIESVTIITLFYILCHNGTDSLVMARKLKGEDLSGIYFFRIFGFLLSAIIWTLFYRSDNLLLYDLVVLFAFLGVSIPDKQLGYLVSGCAAEVALYRAAPEIFSSVVRLLVIANGEKGAVYLVLSYILSDALQGLINLQKNNCLFRLLWAKGILKKISSSRSLVLFSAFVIAETFLFQKGDAFLITIFNFDITSGPKAILKQQQLFDSSGLLVFAIIPFLSFFLKKPYLAVSTLTLASAILALLAYFMIEILAAQLNLTAILHPIIDGLSSFSIGYSIGTGFALYSSILLLTTIANLRLVSKLFIVILLLKFMFFYVMCIKYNMWVLYLQSMQLIASITFIYSLYFVVKRISTTRET